VVFVILTLYFLNVLKYTIIRGQRCLQGDFYSLGSAKMKTNKTEPTFSDPYHFAGKEVICYEIVSAEPGGEIVLTFADMTTRKFVEGSKLYSDVKSNIALWL
jgi:hypothetical protein